MAYVYNTVYTIDTIPSLTTFTPCCNVPVSVDYQQRHFQEVYYAPEPPAQIQVVRQRLADPPPDVIDRVIVVPQPKQYVYQVVEVPTKPPPVVRERVVHQAPSGPLCGGSYRVSVPHNSAAKSTGLVQSSSTVQAVPNIVQSSSTVQGAPNIVQSSSTIQTVPTYIQQSPSYIQQYPSYIQQSPVVISSPQVITI